MNGGAQYAYGMNPQMQKGMMNPLQQQQQMAMVRPGGVPGQPGAFGPAQGGMAGGPMGPGGPVGPGGPGQGRPGMMPAMNQMQNYQMMGKGMAPMQMPMGKQGFVGGMAQAQMAQMPQQGKGAMMGPGAGVSQGGMRPGMGPNQGVVPGIPGGQMGGMQNGAGNQVLTAQALATQPTGIQKQMLGEKLYPAVSRLQPDLAGKITGMMLEMDNNEVLVMLDNEAQLRQKVEEAVRVLNNQSSMK